MVVWRTHGTLQAYTLMAYGQSRYTRKIMELLQSYGDYEIWHVAGDGVVQNACNISGHCRAVFHTYMYLNLKWQVLPKRNACAVWRLDVCKCCNVAIRISM